MKPKKKASINDIAVRVSRNGPVRTSWKATTRERCGADLRRKGTMHKLTRELRGMDAESFVVKLEAELAENAHVLSSYFGGSVALFFPKTDLMCTVSDYAVTLATPDVELLKWLEERSVLPALWEKDSIHVLMNGFEGPELSYAGRLSEPFEPMNYEPDVAAKLQSIFTWADAPKPYGRMVLLRGPTGAGKSYAGRAMITETKTVEWVYVPPNSVPSLTRPDMIDILIGARSGDGPLGLLVEDADALLRTRTGIHDQTVAQLLNLGDGILGDIADLRIVLTTNLERRDIDKALLRPGRLFQFVDFGLLSPERAAQVYQRESGGQVRVFTEPQVLAEVYALAHEHRNGAEDPAVKASALGVYV